MAAQLRRIAILIVGWLFILLGVVGLFLPFLQGFLFQESVPAEELPAALGQAPAEVR